MAAIKTPKLKKTDRKRLIKQLDREISRYIRLSNADVNGYVQCITCLEVKQWKSMQAGHYVSRQFHAARWLEKNIYPQCVGCNIFKKGNYKKYDNYLDDRFGYEFRRNLQKLENVTFRATTDWLLRQKEEYQILNAKFKNLF